MSLISWLNCVLIALMMLCAGCGGEPPPAVPEFAAPDFTLTALDGETVTLRDLRGGWVVVNFWATWCVPCVEEMPVLQAAADTLPVTVLGINQRESAEAVEAFAAEHGIRFPLLLDPDDATLANYQVIGLPQTLVIAPNGEIVFRQFGALDLQTFLDDLRGLMGT